MMVIVWWTVASVVVSLFVGAFLVQGAGPARVLDLTRLERRPEPLAPPSETAPGAPSTP